MKVKTSKIFLLLLFLIATVVFSWFYYNKKISVAGLWVNTVPEIEINYNHHGDKSDVIIFMWDVPNMHSDWTGILERPYLDDFKSEEPQDQMSNPNSLEIDYPVPTNYITTPERKCSVSCMFTHNYEYFQKAHGIVFDPYYMDSESWRRIPMKLPEKHPHQKFALFHHNPLSKYSLLSHPTYMARMDYNVNYLRPKANATDNSVISTPEITLACSPYSSDRSINRVIKLLHKPINLMEKTKKIAFMSSNCAGGYASIRTGLVSTLMKLLKIDSYGKCLNNIAKSISPKDSYQNVNDRIRYNMEIFKDYKFVIAFENENSTNYVTEKIYSALYAGAIPIYMGADNIDDYVPTGSYINVKDFTSIKDLARKIKLLLINETEYQKYFAWKNNPLENKVIDKLKRCVNSYESKCSICEMIHSGIPEEAQQYRKDKIIEMNGYYHSFYLDMSGKGDHIIIEESPQCKGAFNLTKQFTFMAWVKPSSFGDQRIIDKNYGGTIEGYNFDILKSDDPKFGYARLCASISCFESKKRLSTDVWHHLAVTTKNNDVDIHKNKIIFYVDGVFDFEYDNLDDTRSNNLPLTIGKISNYGDINYGTYHGNLDNIIIFNRSISAEEVRNLVWQKPYGDEEGLILYLDFDYNNLKMALDRTIIEDKSSCKNIGHLKKGSNNDYSQRILSYGKEVTFNKCL